MKKKNLFIFSFLFLILILGSLIFINKTNAATGDCYLNTFTTPGGDGVCFICTNSPSQNSCTTECGSQVCWE